MPARRLPDEREAAEGMARAAANAGGLLRDADLLASGGSYGRALALAVLAFEESVKSRTLGAIVTAAEQGRQPGFTDDDLRRIVYNNHQARYAAGFLQHIAAELPDLYGKFMLRIAVSAGEAAELQRLLGLFTSANSGKQAGLYTDFDPDSGSWRSPDDVGSSDFENIRAVISGFVTETQRQLDEFSRVHLAGTVPASQEST